MAVFKERALASQTVDIVLHAVDSSGVAITGASDFIYSVYRQSDGAQLDFSDSTFGGTITTGTQALTEIGSTAIYSHRLDLSAITNHAAAKDTWYIVFAETGTDLLTIPRGEIVVNPDDMHSLAEIADAVWDEAIAGHAAAGSTGATLSAASAPTAAAVADAVWDELLSGHTDSGSAGSALSASGGAIIKALMLGNYTLDNVVLDGNGHATSQRIRLWDSSANVPSSGGGSETTGLLGTITLASTPNTSYPTLSSFFRGTLVEP